ncbi:hypothetical protein C7S10_18185 [Nocardioides currus]|uniref:HTH cro/C1-type domain-containing protein n=1 Tax=Nocardioides currus TaxID=2133958 RepID=A0A2R7YUH6_9ACTN|nr:hypothetical protein C7S10_18185 [Nocardioides currus]
MVRRARRRARLSQRELAHELGVSQSAVAKWETGRRSPSARMLARVLEVADLRLAAVGPDGQRVRPMRSVAARDAAGRRYPAHAFVWTQGWWAPTGAESTAWIGPILARSCDLGLPRVRYGRWWELGREPTLADLDDHPTWAQLVAEARAGREPRHRTPFHIPEWVLVDTHRSRNRRPEDFRGPPPRIGPVPPRIGPVPTRIGTVPTRIGTVPSRPRDG